MTRFSVVITFKQFYASIKIFDWKYKRILFYFSHVPRRHNIYKEWRLLQNMGKMESHYITVRNCTYYIKKEFLRLFQKILVWGNNKKRRSFPSLPNLTETQSYLLRLWASTGCLLQLQTFTLYTGFSPWLIQALTNPNKRQIQDIQ